MKQVVILIVIFLFPSTSHPYNEKYKLETLAFLDFIVAEELKTDSLLLNNEVNVYRLKNCKWILDDREIFSKEEKDTIIQQIMHPMVERWQEFLLGSANKDSTDFLTLARVKPGVWMSTSVYKPKKITSFSAPIFLRNYSVCLFYWEQFCRGACANGQVRLYIKENNKWMMKKEYCSWFAD